MNEHKLINFKLSRCSYQEFADRTISAALARKQGYICLANVHMFCEAHSDAEFLDTVNGADMVAADGKPLTWALRLLYGVRQERIAGMDLLPTLIRSAAENRVSIYFYGGSHKVIEAAIKTALIQYPDLKIAGAYCPPFRALSDREENDIVQKINDASPHLVFVALGCPKQEKWMASMNGKVHAVMVGVGGAVSVFAGMQRRAPEWMQQAGLEWCYRLMQEPRRLFKRYAATNSRFVWIVGREFVRLRLNRKAPHTQNRDPETVNNTHIL